MINRKLFLQRQQAATDMLKAVQSCMSNDYIKNVTFPEDYKKTILISEYFDTTTPEIVENRISFNIGPYRFFIEANVNLSSNSLPVALSTYEIIKDRRRLSKDSEIQYKEVPNTRIELHRGMKILQLGRTTGSIPTITDVWELYCQSIISYIENEENPKSFVAYSS